MINKQKAVIQLSLMAVMSALVTVGTFIVQIPIGMGGYFNVGDAMIFVAALTFNPLIGGVAGGLGSALADLPRFSIYAPFTFVIKGFEGFIASLISNKKSVLLDVFAVVMAGVEMVVGYFLVDTFLYGLGVALGWIPLNILQIVVGGLIGVPIALILRRRLPEIIR
ncbi:ECF transporter S component [Thermoproteota archaeon]